MRSTSTVHGCAPPSTRRAVGNVSSSVVTASRTSSSVAAVSQQSASAYLHLILSVTSASSLSHASCRSFVTWLFCVITGVHAPACSHVLSPLAHVCGVRCLVGPVDPLREKIALDFFMKQAGVVGARCSTATATASLYFLSCVVLFRVAAAVYFLAHLLVPPRRQWSCWPVRRGHAGNADYVTSNAPRRGRGPVGRRRRRNL